MLDTQALLASIVESSDDAIIGVSLDGSILSWNSGAETIYGYKANEVMGRALSSLTLPERVDEIPNILAQIRRGERIKHFHTMHLCKSGRVIFVSLSISPIIDSRGRLFGAAAIARDITRHLRDEQEIRETEEKYRLLFSAEADAILLFDADAQTLVNANRAATCLYGYSQEELGAFSPNQLCPAWRENGLGTVHGGGEAVCNIPLTHHTRKDGSTFVAEMSASSFLWRGRRMLVWIVRDITERQRIESIKHSLALARDIQQHLLPKKPPEIKGLDIHVRSLYSEEVGGDYHDLLAPSVSHSNTLEFLVGDISGHGISAALLMAMAKGILINEIEHHNTSPAEIFTSVNNRLVADTDDSIFMTMFYGKIDMNTRTLEWNSAGQGPVFWYQASRQNVKELPTTNLPLGILPDALASLSQSIQLRQGDILLVGTDGLWEAHNQADQMFGTARLRQILASWADKSAKEIAEIIFRKVLAFSERDQPEDDMTALVIKVTE